MELLSWGSEGWGDEFVFALFTTLSLALSSYIFGMVVGLLLAVVKVYKKPVWKKLANGYTTIIRGVPELLIIYLLFFGGETFLTSLAGAFGYNGYIQLPAFLIGTISIGLISGAYSCEVFRGAITSVPVGQTEASKSLSMDKNFTFIRIILPQALRQAIPALGNIWQLTLKDTALISVTGLAELMRVSRMASNTEREPFLFFVTATLLFLLFAYSSTKFQNKLENKFSKGFHN